MKPSFLAKELNQIPIFGLIVIFVAGIEFGYIVWHSISTRIEPKNIGTIISLFEVLVITVIGTLIAWNVNRSGISLNHTLTEDSRIQQRIIACLLLVHKNLLDQIKELKPSLDQHCLNYKNEHRNILEGNTDTIKLSTKYIEDQINILENDWNKLITDLVEEGILKRSGSTLEANTGKHDPLAINILNVLTRLRELLAISRIKYSKYFLSSTNKNEANIPSSKDYDDDIGNCYSYLNSQFHSAHRRLVAISGSQI